MPEPVVFISRFRIKESNLEAYRELQRRGTAAVQAQKPRTLVYLAFTNADQTRLAIIHAFADADAMDVHIEGTEERARVAYEILEPEGWEVYGSPSEDALGLLRRTADSFGVPLTAYQDYAGGFLRAADVDGPPRA